MNDEIKEILDRLKGQDNDYHYCLKKDISFNDNMYCSHILLDYITNLQQELEIMVKDDERSQETIIRLTKENERLKEETQQEIKEANDSITWWTNRFKAVERDNRKLKQENK